MSLVQKPAPDFKADTVVGKLFKSVQSRTTKGKWLVSTSTPRLHLRLPHRDTAFSDRTSSRRSAPGRGLLHRLKFRTSWTHPRKEGGWATSSIRCWPTSPRSARDYGVLIEEAGIALRGLFVINPEGKVVYQVIHDLGVGRSVDETLRVIKAFQQVAKTGEVCPANWTEGKKTMKPDTQKSKEYFAAAA